MSFTYKPKKKKRQKTHGFLSRSKTVAGRRILKARRHRRRVKITV